jgi:hypothetical protein
VLKYKELVEIAKTQWELTSSQRLPKQAKERIESQNPFTWILTVNCSDKLLNLCEAKPDPELGMGVYRLSPLLRMGIVIIDRLTDNTQTIWLKMLGDKESAKAAFGAIEQLSPDRREKNDIISACIKYCVYLRDLPTDSLTPEEQDFMKTMAQIDALYEAEINKAKLEGKLEGKAIGEELQKQSIALNLLRENVPLEIISRTTGLTIEQLQQLQSSSTKDRSN